MGFTPIFIALPNRYGILNMGMKSKNIATLNIRMHWKVLANSKFLESKL